MESKEPSDIRAELFFRRAREEALRYGGDRWVFLRELVQNSRDAGASSIYFTTTTTGGVEEITCRDDGSGMDRLEVEWYFLRLYASSKEQNADLLGYFGVGFWSVLLLEPDTIRVSTRKWDETTSFEIDCTTSLLTHTDYRLDEPGTEITLCRSTDVMPAPRAFEDTVRERLLHYAGHIRPIPGLRAIDLFLNMERLNRPFPLPPLSPRRFRTRKFDGVVGLGPVPFVRIYKGGILVSDVVTLDEVIPSRKTRLPKTGWGMYPTVAINVDGLKLLLDRRKIFEDPLLHEAARFCERELMRLHDKLIRRSLPMNLKNGLLRLASRATVKRAVNVTALLMILAMSTFVAAQLVIRFHSSPIDLTKQSGPARHDLAPQNLQRKSLDVPLSAWIGSEVAPRTVSTFLGDLSYDGTARLLFRLRTFPSFDARRGFAPEEHRVVGEYPIHGERGRERISVEVGVSGGPNPFVLPIPDGHVLIKESLRIGMERGQDVLINTYQEPLVQVSRPARLKYAVVRAGTVLAPQAPPERPELLWPDYLETLLSRIRQYPINQRVREIRDFIANNYAYTRVEPVRLLFQPHTSWVADVLARREGDCDVLNGLAVLLLRSADIEAHLSVGLIGKNGRVVPGLHAWARYIDDGWRILDITENVPVIGTDYDMGTISHDVGDSRAAQGTAPHDDASLQRADDARALLNDDVPAAKERTGGVPLAAAAGTGLALLFGWLVFVLRSRLSREKVEPEYIRDMFVHHFREGRGGDLDLEFRPVFRLLDGRTLSLAEIQRVAARHGLYGAYPTTELISLVARDLPLLDRSSKTVGLLEPLLPPVVWLEELPLAEDSRQICPELQNAQAIIQRMDPDFRVHLITDSATIQELTLRLNGPSSGVRHVLIGENNPLYSAIREGYRVDPTVGTFRAVELLLQRTTFYTGERAVFLSTLAQQLSREKPALGRHSRQGQTGAGSD